MQTIIALHLMRLAQDFSQRRYDATEAELYSGLIRSGVAPLREPSFLMSVLTCRPLAAEMRHP
jgi:hypothetical protein